MPPRSQRLHLVHSRPSQRVPWWVKFPIAYAVAGAFLLGSLVFFGVERSGLGQWLLDPPATTTSTSAAHLVTAQFDVCKGGGRVTCVVDGDTFWLGGVKYRLADFNAPEVGTPSCAEEAVLGARATLRLASLLNAGPFSLADYERDEDQYGRKLRIVERDGRSIADTMIAEGLAHPWRGKRESWC